MMSENSTELFPVEQRHGERNLNRVDFMRKRKFELHSKVGGGASHDDSPLLVYSKLFVY